MEAKNVAFFFFFLNKQEVKPKGSFQKNKNSLTR